MDKECKDYNYLDSEDFKEVCKIIESSILEPKFEKSKKLVVKNDKELLEILS